MRRLAVILVTNCDAALTFKNTKISVNIFNEAFDCGQHASYHCEVSEDSLSITKNLCRHLFFFL